MIDISNKYSTRKRTKKKVGKCTRLLISSKRTITKQLKKSGLAKETITWLKRRKNLVLEHLEKERTMESKRKIDKAVQEIKEDGGIKHLLESEERVMGKTTNDMAAILDEEGIRQEDPDAIKEVYI